ncbi:MAG: TetR/AcrR family transcriptional regulator [Sphingomonadales bacterium]
MEKREDSRDEIRERIIDAASALFTRYGYGKTCMADIARDCEMSPGNLYRYFENKLEIAAQIVRREFERELAAQARFLTEPGLTAAERLRRYVIGEMEGTYAQLEEFPTLLEQTREVRAKRPLLVHEYLAQSRELIAEILKMGNISGEFEFEVEDLIDTAEMIQAATLKFRYPQIHSRLTLDQLKRELDGVLDLLINGLQAD